MPHGPQPGGVGRGVMSDSEDNDENGVCFVSLLLLDVIQSY